MGEKCALHDDCFGRLNDKMDESDRKQEKRFGEVREWVREIRDMLHSGDIRFTRMDSRIDSLEKDIANIKEASKARGNKAWGFVQAILAPLAVVVIVALFTYAWADKEKQLDRQIKVMQKVETALAKKLDAIIGPSE